MPRYNVEHNGKWAAFSSIVDDFVTPFMDKDAYERWRINEYGRAGYKNVEECNVEAMAEVVFIISLNRAREEAIECLINAGIDEAEAGKLMDECEAIHYCPIEFTSAIRCPNCAIPVERGQEHCTEEGCGIRLVWRREEVGA